MHGYTNLAQRRMGAGGQGIVCLMGWCGLMFVSKLNPFEADAVDIITHMGWDEEVRVMLAT
jgi:hypothetical protein